MFCFTGPLENTGCTWSQNQNFGDHEGGLSHGMAEGKPYRSRLALMNASF